MLTKIRPATLVYVVGLATITVSCGNSVGPVPRSTLPDVLPSVSAFDLIKAFPSPHDLGPGWTFDTGSLGSEDYFVDYSQSDIAHQCAYGRPNSSHIPGLSNPQSPMSISGGFTPSSGGTGVLVIITVDTPAKSADRLALMRRAYANCGTVNVTRDGVGFTEIFTPLPTPAADADERLAVRLAITETSSSDASQGTQDEEAAFARVGGVVVAIYGYNDPASLRDAVRFLPIVTAKVRRVLRI